MTIIHNPGPANAARDIEDNGRWQWIWRRQIGDSLVTWQWIRIRSQHLGGCTWRTTYRDPKGGNRVFHSEDETVSGW